MKLGLDLLKFTEDAANDHREFLKYTGSLYRKIGREIEQKKYDGNEEVFGSILGKKIIYEFSQGDLDEVQNLLNQLRELLTKTDELDDKHKRRMLNRLENLQAELHKVVSDLDGFWGFFIDASIVVGMMGENAKPTVDVIQKIVKIIWPTQTRAYDLPSDLPFKLLDQSKDEEYSDT